MTAADYVKQYHDITVPKFALTEGPWRMFGGGIVATPVTEYCNARHSMYTGKSFKQRWSFYEALVRFFRDKMAKDSTSGVNWGSGPGVVNSWAPISGFKKSEMQASFEGKAPPAKLAQTIQLISYWASYKGLVDGASTQTVPELVDDYLGMDCNGFVGNYLKEKFSNVKCKASTPEEQYLVWGKYGGVVRKGMADLAIDDVIVFDGHIAIISKVILATDKDALVEISESRTRKSKKGGPQTNSWNIRYKNGVFDIVDRDTEVKGIVRISGME
ncbi:MAG: hypothetical protein ABI972_15965 [Acidobacteriota bacterium]